MKENMMNVARKLVFISLGFLACAAADAQVNCASSGKLICLVPFVTNAIQGSTNPNTNETDAVQKASIFNGPIGAQLSQLPFATAAPGAIILKGANGLPVTYKNLGSIFLDRPDSVGLGTFVFGFSFQQFNFNHLDGIDIGNIPFVYKTTNSTPGNFFPIQYVSQTENVNLKLNQYVLSGTYGIGKKSDLTVVVPFGQVSIGAAPLNYTTYNISSNNQLGQSFVTAQKNIQGNSHGIGDVSVIFKQQLWSGGETGHGALAAGMAIRFSTGDALNYLGSGAYGFNLFALASYKAPISPHVKIAYQWNSSSVLLNPTGLGPKLNLPGGAQYGGGFDTAMSKYFTASADILANEFVNSPYITPGCLTIPESSLVVTSTSGCGTSIATPSPSTQNLTTLTQTTVTYTTANLSLGMKYQPFRNTRSGLVIYGNVLIQLNNVGLRSDPSPSAGISYNFGTTK